LPSSPEKAGVGGSIPSLATTFFNHLAATAWTLSTRSLPAIGFSGVVSAALKMCLELTSSLHAYFPSKEFAAVLWCLRPNGPKTWASLLSGLLAPRAGVSVGRFFALDKELTLPTCKSDRTDWEFARRRFRHEHSYLSRKRKRYGVTSDPLARIPVHLGQCKNLYGPLVNIS
jgi:hypothetical protein